MVTNSSDGVTVGRTGQEGCRNRQVEEDGWGSFGVGVTEAITLLRMGTVLRTVKLTPKNRLGESHTQRLASMA